MLDAVWNNSDQILEYFRTITGMEPITVSPTRITRMGPTVWSVYTEAGTFYIVDGRYREMFRRGKHGHLTRQVCRSASEALERYLELHPDEAVED